MLPHVWSRHASETLYLPRVSACRCCAESRSRRTSSNNESLVAIPAGHGYAAAAWGRRIQSSLTRGSEIGERQPTPHHADILRHEPDRCTNGAPHDLGVVSLGASAAVHVRTHLHAIEGPTYAVAVSTEFGQIQEVAPRAVRIQWPLDGCQPLIDLALTNSSHIMQNIGITPATSSLLTMLSNSLSVGVLSTIKGDSHTTEDCVRQAKAYCQDLQGRTLLGNEVLVSRLWNARWTLRLLSPDDASHCVCNCLLWGGFDRLNLMTAEAARVCV
ncbi:hypothetical protein OBBRIDRAFT_90426 [Obba rivulosa]|uniref:Uncharacterized protein n=1 Tax=Obba rivulosa TaxID=1052685 RepID=A0A8E2AUI8_9APHY|nr:hypothetical protein OBBRIDRAFT_90426 [Obba rivulosa]